MPELKVEETTLKNTEETGSALVPHKESPISVIPLEEITKSVALLKATLPDGAKMSREQLGAVAIDAMLTGTIPGRDVHYFESKGRLLKVDDFKLLIRWANEKEVMATGDPSAKFNDSYRDLTDEERISEKVFDGDVATYCTIISDRDMDKVGGWVRNGATFEQALALVGTTAIGVVRKGDNNIPKGWSAGQKARKLAQKATIRARYGQPSMDELAAFRRRWAKVATDQDWQQVDQSLPLEAQARLADLTAISREAQEAASKRTPEEREVALEERTNILRGPIEEIGIGDDEPVIHPDDDREVKEAAANRVSLGLIEEKIPWFSGPQSIEDAMLEEGWTFDDPDLVEKLDGYAHNAMDAEIQASEGEPSGQGSLFADNMPF